MPEPDRLEFGPFPLMISIAFVLRRNERNKSQFYDTHASQSASV